MKRTSGLVGGAGDAKLGAAGAGPASFAMSTLSSFLSWPRLVPALALVAGAILAGCGDDGGALPVDAAVDGAPVDAPVDAPGPESTLLAGQVGSWALDGNGRDRSGLDLPLFPSATVEWPVGRFGKAARFTAVAGQDLVRLRDDPPLRLTTGSFTLSVWVQVEVATNRIIVSKGGYGGWWLGLLDDAWAANDGEGSQVRFAPPAGLVGGWHHLILSREQPSADTNLVRLYLDGEVVAESHNPLAQNPSPAAGVRVGAAAEFPTSFGGLVDELGIWDRALTAEERAYLGAHPVPGRPVWP